MRERDEFNQEEDRLSSDEDAREALQVQPVCEECGADLRLVEIELGLEACEGCTGAGEEPFERAYRMGGR